PGRLLWGGGGGGIAVLGGRALAARHLLDIGEGAFPDPRALKQLGCGLGQLGVKPGSRGFHRARLVRCHPAAADHHCLEVETERECYFLGCGGPARLRDLAPLLTRVHAPGRSRPDVAVQRPPVDLWLRSYEGAGALSGVHEALDSQEGECPCRRGTRHAPLLSDLALRRNLFPRLKLAPRDLVTDVSSD